MTITIDKDGWIKEAIGIYYSGRSWGAFTEKPRQIVIHGTAGGNAQNIATSWAASDGDASAHILINKDGSFVQGLSLDWTAWANCCLTDNPNTGGRWDRRLPIGNQNAWSIAIEHCKDDTQRNSDILTPAQQATSFALCKAICEYHNIPKQVIGFGDISNGGIIGHCNIDALNRTYCPGPYPWKELQESLKGATQHMGTFSNQTAVDVWNSQLAYFTALKQPLPPRDTGIFHAWVNEWKAGRFKGVPLSDEWPITMPDDGKGLAQNYGGGTCTWYKGVAGWL